MGAGEDNGYSSFNNNSAEPANSKYLHNLCVGFEIFTQSPNSGDRILAVINTP